MRYERILSAFFGSIWAIVPEKYEAIKEFLELKASGVDFSEQEIRGRIGAATQPRDAPSGTAIAVIPIRGIISQRINLMDEISGGGGTSTEAVSQMFRQALADPAVASIVIDIDSPGGTVYGVAELVEEIFKARGQKPITAIANSLAASAAYWIASAADEIVVTPGGEVGSIGVFSEHVDYSKWLEAEGVKPTLIFAGKYKVEANQWEPLGEDARAEIQGRVDEYYDMFVKGLARNRGVTVAEVRKGFGEGRVVGAKVAESLGMVDRVATFDQIIKRRLARPSGNRAIADGAPFLLGAEGIVEWHKTADAARAVADEYRDVAGEEAIRQYRERLKWEFELL